MFLYGYLDGWYEECLQCSYSCEIQSKISRLEAITANTEDEPAHLEMVTSHAAFNDYK
jgi:hypothetical protein